MKEPMPSEHGDEWLEGEDPSEWNGLLLCPPWRARLPDGRLGPWYGPGSPEEYDARLKDWRDSYAGGGLWDESEVPKTRQRKERRALDRYDAAPMRAFVRLRSQDLPMRELEVYTLFYVDGLSRAKIGARLGISQITVYG